MILDKILKDKKSEINRSKKLFNLNYLKDIINKSDGPLSLKKALTGNIGNKNRHPNLNYVNA